MSINDLPVLAALRTKMQWHQERQRVLSENVSNSDTPNFKPRDLVEPKFEATGASAGSTGSLAMRLAYRSSDRRRPKLRAGSQGRFPDQARRQCRQPRRPDAEGLRQPDGLCGGDLALQQEPASSEDRDRQGLKNDPENWEPVIPRTNAKRLPGDHARTRCRIGERDHGKRWRRFRPLDEHRDIRSAR